MKKICTLLMLFTAFQITAQETKKVLFVGNSYTYGNNLPGLVESLANANGDNLIKDQNTPGGYTFNQHSSNATTLNKIAADEWDFVVLQAQSQEPSFPPGQVASQTKPYAEILCDSVYSNNACSTPLFFMTWGRENGDQQNCPNYTPLCTYEGMQQRLRETYLDMATENNASVAPVGMAWKKVREDFPSIGLYTSDESHPNINGSYLAACVFYTTIFNKSAVGNTFTSTLDSLTAFRLQTIASATVFDSLNVWKIDTNAVLPVVIDSTISACDSVDVNGTWFYTDTMFSDTTVVNAPCDIEIVNYIIEVNNENAEILDFNQIILLKTNLITGIFISINVQYFDSLILYESDTIVEVFFQNSTMFEYNCGEDVYDDLTFTLVAINECNTDSLTRTFSCLNNTSIKDLNLNDWKISPNPTNNFINIVSSSNQKFTSSLVDISGREIIRKTSETRLDISTLDKGIYFVVFYNEDGLAIGQKRIIKN